MRSTGASTLSDGSRQSSDAAVSSALAATATSPRAAARRTASAAFPAAFADYCALTKPGITFFVTLTAGAGFLLAAGPGSTLTFVAMLLATALTSGGAAALNQYVERDVDARMLRTRERPLPAARLRPGRALLFGTALTAAGLTLGLARLPLATTAILALSLVSYVWIYTPLKRITSLCTLVGAVPGALPILAGWTAAGGELAPGGLLMFGILFLWQIPHFLSIAWLCRDDYVRGGLDMLSNHDPDGRLVARQSALYALVLVPVSVGPAVLGILGMPYFLGALALGLAYLLPAMVMLHRPSDRAARRLFLTSLAYLPLLIMVMALDRALV